jgi:hypothetical protein
VATSQPVVIIFLPLVDVVRFQSAVALYTARVYNLITSFPADPDRLDSTRSHLKLRLSTWAGFMPKRSYDHFLFEFEKN